MVSRLLKVLFWIYLALGMICSVVIFVPLTNGTGAFIGLVIVMFWYLLVLLVSWIVTGSGQAIQYEAFWKNLALLPIWVSPPIALLLLFGLF